VPREQQQNSPDAVVTLQIKETKGTEEVEVDPDLGHPVTPVNIRRGDVG
jgi:hypothetical protein